MEPDFKFKFKISPYTYITMETSNVESTNLTGVDELTKLIQNLVPPMIQSINEDIDTFEDSLHNSFITLLNDALAMMQFSMNSISVYDKKASHGRSHLLRVILYIYNIIDDVPEIAQHLNITEYNHDSHHHEILTASLIIAIYHDVLDSKYENTAAKNLNMNIKEYRKFIINNMRHQIDTFYSMNMNIDKLLFANKIVYHHMIETMIMIITNISWSKAVKRDFKQIVSSNQYPSGKYNEIFNNLSIAEIIVNQADWLDSYDLLRCYTYDVEKSSENNCAVDIKQHLEHVVQHWNEKISLITTKIIGKNSLTIAENYHNLNQTIISHIILELNTTKMTQPMLIESIQRKRNYDNLLTMSVDNVKSDFNIITDISDSHMTDGQFLNKKRRY